jgi:hypothetical protein
MQYPCVCIDAWNSTSAICSHLIHGSCCGFHFSYICTSQETLCILVHVCICRMHACMYVCIYLCYVCMYACMYVCMYCYCVLYCIVLYCIVLYCIVLCVRMNTRTYLYLQTHFTHIHTRHVYLHRYMNTHTRTRRVCVANPRNRVSRVC